MKNLKTVFYLLAILVCTLFMTTGLALAQPPGGGTEDQAGGQMQGGPMGQQGGPGGMQMQQMDQEQMQQMMAERYKELLEMSDEEWAVIGPYVLKVSSLSQASQTRGSGMRMMGGRGNMPQDSQAEGQAPGQGQRGRGMMTGTQDENLEALQTLLEDENATSDEIKSKLAALRKARETAKKELAVARKELQELLTLRQEAICVINGILE